jgi:alpha-tubulin suppressor-like RCC1 family protein
MCVLLFNGSINCAGFNYYGQLWLGTAGLLSAEGPVNMSDANLDVLLPATVLAGIPVRSVSCGFSFSYAVSLAGGNKVYCVGLARGNSLGDGSYTEASITQPVTVLNLLQTPSIVQLASGLYSSCALYSGPAISSSVQCWGDTYSSTNARIAGVDMATALAVSSFDAGCVVLRDATVACWDGLPLTTTKISGISGVVHVTMGGEFACAVVKDKEDLPGSVWCWRLKERTGLTQFVVDSETPQKVRGLLGWITDVVAGDAHVCAVVTTSVDRVGEVYCWGHNGYEVYCWGHNGYEVYCWGHNGYEVYCWGHNGYEVYCWGHNGYGQLGQGYTNGTFAEPGGTKAPQRVKGLMNVTAVYAGSDMTCAVTTTRQVVPGVLLGQESCGDVLAAQAWVLPPGQGSCGICVREGAWSTKPCMTDRSTFWQVYMRLCTWASRRCCQSVHCVVHARLLHNNHYDDLIESSLPSSTRYPFKP